MPEYLGRLKIFGPPKHSEEQRAKWRAASRRWPPDVEKKRARARRCYARKQALKPKPTPAEAQALRDAAKERERAGKRRNYHATKAKNRDKLRARSRAWRLANPGKMCGLLKDWRARNTDKVRADKRGRRIAKRAELRANLTRLQRGRCAVCHDKLASDAHLDHIMPRKLGGSNDRSNFQLTCPTCNLTKSAQHPLDHARSLGRLL